MANADDTKSNNIIVYFEILVCAKKVRLHLKFKDQLPCKIINIENK